MVTESSAGDLSFSETYSVGKRLGVRIGGYAERVKGAVQRRRALKDVERYVVATPVYQKTLASLGIDPNKPFTHNHTVIGSAQAQVIRVEVVQGATEQNFVLHVNKIPPHEAHHEGNRRFEKLSQLYTAAQERLTDEGKRRFVVPKPLFEGTVTKKDGSSYACMTMELLDGYNPTFFAVKSDDSSVELVNYDKQEKRFVTTGISDEVALRDLLVTHALTYRLLGNQFPTQSALAQGDHISKKGQHGGLDFAVVDIMGELTPFESDDHWKDNMQQQVDHPFFADRGIWVNFHPYMGADITGALSIADSLLLPQ